MPCGLFYATTFISQHLDKSCMILFECASCPPDYKNLMMTPWQGVSSGWSCGPDSWSISVSRVGLFKKTTLILPASSEAKKASREPTLRRAAKPWAAEEKEKSLLSFPLPHRTRVSFGVWLSRDFSRLTPKREQACRLNYAEKGK